MKHWGKEAAVDMTLKKYSSMKRSIMSEKGIDDPGEMRLIYWATQELMERNMVTVTMGRERKERV